MKVVSLLHKTNAQATVELAIMIPIVMIIAFIGFNVVSFLSECASFDRGFKESVACLSTSPAYGQSINDTKNDVLENLSKNINKPNITYSVNVEAINGNLWRYDGRLDMKPTLFGIELRDEIFNCKFPSMSHKQSICVDAYKQGVWF